MPKESTKLPRDGHEGEEVLSEATKILVGSVAAFVIFIVYRKLVFGY